MRRAVIVLIILFIFKIQRMKVFSKGTKHNKSTPLLQSVINAPSLQPSAKPKGISKVTSFKNKLGEHKQTVGNSFELRFGMSANQSAYPNTQRSIHEKSHKGKWDRSIGQFVNSFYASPIPMTNSVDYNSCQSDRDHRNQQEIDDKIESVLCYGKFIDKENASKQSNKSKQDYALRSNTNITNFMTKSNSQKDMGFDIKKIYAMGGNYGKQNCAGNEGRKESNRKINHYKNSKILGHAYKVVEKERPKLSLSSFRMGRKLGRGRFGNVHMVQQKNTGMIFALKQIDLKQVKEEEMQSQLIQEMKLQLFMSHPNILKMYGYFRQNDDLYMILEYANQKCLFNKIHLQLEQKMVGYYTRQMLQALKYCHSESILHRDLKPENILLCQGVAKLADFGWAAYAPKYKRNTFCGTLDYVPPQILKGKYYDQKVDIWSLGVLIYEMATGRAPFETQSINPVHIEAKTMNRILDGDLMVPFTLSVELRKLILSILTTEPERRPSLQQIEGNPWLQDARDVHVEIGQGIWTFWMGMVEN